MIKTIGVTGAGGLVGTTLVPLLVAQGYEVILFQRTKRSVSPMTKQNIKTAYWNYETQEIDADALKQCNAFIHLAGAGVADKRWTKARKQLLLSSRKKGTKFLTEKILLHASECAVFISASAIGFYGEDKAPIAPFEEKDKRGDGFLASVCEQWEQASMPLESKVRRVVLRIGIVLAQNGGALKKMIQPLSYRINPIMGSGEQTVSWIHIDDLCAALLFALQKDSLRGIYNAVSPDAVTYKKLMSEASQYYRKPILTLNVPPMLLRIGLGELAEELLKSQTVSSKKLENAGYTFRYGDVASALNHLLQSPNGEN